MARQEITVTQSPGKTASPQAAQTAGIVLVMAQATTSEGLQCQCTGKELIVARNSTTTPRTITITSAPDTFGRTGDITTHALAGGTSTTPGLGVNVYGPFPVEGWRQTDGKLYFSASATSVEVGVVVLP